MQPPPQLSSCLDSARERHTDQSTPAQLYRNTLSSDSPVVVIAFFCSPRVWQQFSTAGFVRFCSAAPLGARGMATGTAKWFNIAKGFGFITPDDKTEPDGACFSTPSTSGGMRFQRHFVLCYSVLICNDNTPAPICPPKPNSHVAAVFVHQTSVQSTGYRFLKEGEKVKFDIADTQRGRAAVNVTDLEGKPFNRTRDDAMAAKPPRKMTGDKPERPASAPSGGAGAAAGGARKPAAAKPAAATAAAPKN